MLAWNFLKRAKYALAIAAVLSVIAFGSAPATATYTWSWGYNYVGQNVNSNVTGPWNYYQTITLYKNSGDYVQFGFNPSSSCNITVWQNTTYYETASGLGCGGYLQPYVKWVQGNTSYLKIQAST
jgi:hypothetical protein